MTRNNFTINVKWGKTDETPPEIGDSSGDIEIKVNNWSATRHYDLFSNTLRDTASVASYPMALWFAYNWWRLLHEPYPFNSQNTASHGWRSAHDLPSAGNGFVWPPLRFIPTGAEIFVVIASNKADSLSDVRYDLDGGGYVERGEFERVIEQFIEKTIARLEHMNHHDTELHVLWRDVKGERSNPKINLYRTIEACLGFDPDFGPSDLIERLVDKAAEASKESIKEIAAAFSIESLTISGNDAVEKIFHLNGNGLPATFNLPRFQPESIKPLDEKPWDAGHSLAQQLRSFLNFGDRAIASDDLAALFSLGGNTLRCPGEHILPLQRLSLGVPCESDPNDLKIYLHLATETGRRFYLARILGDHLLNSEQPRVWLPATASRTWRQKFQRAFAAEFLCPLNVLESRMIPDDPDQDLFNDTAVEYGLDFQRLVNHWQVNHPPEWSDLVEFAQKN